MAAVVVVIEVLFQSTCLREARHPHHYCRRRIPDFNPRACVRHDSPPPSLRMPV